MSDVRTPARVRRFVELLRQITLVDSELRLFGVSKIGAVALFERVDRLAMLLDTLEQDRLLLVVEVVSPTTARADRFAKRRLYQEVGVAAYWIVDPDQQLVEAWTPNAALPAIARERVEWLPPGATEPFVLFVAELFRAV